MTPNANRFCSEVGASFSHDQRGFLLQQHMGTNTEIRSQKVPGEEDLGTRKRCRHPIPPVRAQGTSEEEEAEGVEETLGYTRDVAIKSLLSELREPPRGGGGRRG